MKSTGRAAVVLDTGAVTRGSGSKNEDKERNIRKWFVERDYVDGVILLPDNLFYNTTAAGIIIVLRKNKPKDRKGRIGLINASQEFRKGAPKNYLTDEGVKKIADAYLKAKTVEGFASVITNEEAAKNDFNLSPSRYLAANGTAETKSMSAALLHYEQACREEAQITKDVDTVLKQLKALAKEAE